MTYYPTIWRDDDIQVSTDLKQFILVDEIFKKHKVNHTIAVIAKDIEIHQGLVKYIKKNPHIDVQLHCWEHIRYSDMDLFKKHLKFGRDSLEEIFEKPVNIWYPPWNETTEDMNKVAKSLGLNPYPQHTTLMEYLKDNGNSRFDTVIFHYWFTGDVVLLDRALELYNLHQL